jgi:hypothetical protein
MSNYWTNPQYRTHIPAKASKRLKFVRWVVRNIGQCHNLPSCPVRECGRPGAGLARQPADDYDLGQFGKRGVTCPVKVETA